MVNKAKGIQVRLTLFFLFVLVVILTVCVVKHLLLGLRIAFADGQISELVEICSSSANTKSPTELSAKLDYVLNYYPSGTKQTKGSHLDRIVEGARSNAVTAILVRFQVITGKDFEKDPQHWLKEYPPTK